MRAYLRIRARRKARKHAGISGIIMAAGVAVAAIVEQFFPSLSGPATYLLLLAWPIMIGVYGASRVLAPFDTEPVPSKRSLDSWLSLSHGEYESLFYPMAAISLLAPFTLHFVAYALIISGHEGFPAEFDQWIATAGVFAIVPQAALLALCHQFSHARTEALGVVADNDGATLRALFFAAPSALFFFLPPIVAVTTGLFLLPLMFGAFSALHFRERIVLDQLEALTLGADDEAFAHAKALVFSRKAPPPDRAAALRFLVRCYDRAITGSVIDFAMQAEDPLLFRTALIAALALRHRPSPEAFLVLTERTTGGTAAYVAQLLGCYRTPRAQRTLLFLLRDGPPSVKEAAAASLGKVGDLEAIPPLLAMRRMVEGGVVDEAVLAIKTRCAMAPAGALALVSQDDRAGAVSDPGP